MKQIFFPMKIFEDLTWSQPCFEEVGADNFQKNSNINLNQSKSRIP